MKLETGALCVALTLGAAIAAPQAAARTVELAITDVDKDDLACGLRYPELKSRTERALDAVGVRRADEAAYSLIVIITSVKRETYCASDVVVSLRRVIGISETDVFRTGNRRAPLEFCRQGGLVASPLAEHAEHFSQQLERSVRNCFAQLTY